MKIEKQKKWKLLVTRSNPYYWLIVIRNERFRIIYPL